MKYRMHKRVETKPDGRKIYYYTFEPVEVQAQEASPDAHGTSTPQARTLNPAPPTPRTGSERRKL